METLKIDSFLKEDGFDIEKLQEFANTLMKGYCIDNGGYQYYPVEIEFYIYKVGSHEDSHVYPRDNKHAGDLFFHYSGMDICFDSSLDNKCFGGILIRALERIDKEGHKKLFGGPLVCMNEVLNNATKKCKVKNINRLDADRLRAVIFGQRVGINGNDQYDKANYRFKVEGLESISMQRLSFDFKMKKRKDTNSTYKLIEY